MTDSSVHTTDLLFIHYSFDKHFISDYYMQGVALWPARVGVTVGIHYNFFPSSALGQKTEL